MNFDHILREIFLKSVRSVQPKQLFASKPLNIIKTKEGQEVLDVYDKGSKVLEIDLTNKNLKLIGFGKAVYGMAVEVIKLLDNRIKNGILSVPIGTLEKFQTKSNSEMFRKCSIEVLEGAKNNLPDDRSYSSAKSIKNLVENLKNNDLLLVLISGGGSALLPLPTHPITLQEKYEIIKKLASSGASIEEINTVRASISDLKGGKLSELGRHADRIITIIISDIVNNPIELIASGPTCEFHDKNADIILKKYNLWESSSSIRNVISKSKNQKPFISKNTTNLILGSNSLAIQSVIDSCKEFNLIPIILSESITGNVDELSLIYYELTSLIKKYINQEITELDLTSRLEIHKKNLKFHENFSKNIIKGVNELCNTNGHGLCLIAGGEPTVKVNGSGVGGRNQELSLRFSYECSKNKNLHDIRFLSGGTDGIDGPTLAAGAIGNPKMIWDIKNNIEIEKFIENNDSNSFYKKFNEGDSLLMTGHTGTNVMDIHILVIPNKNKFKLY